MEVSELPKHIYTGKWNSGHIQGIAVDTAGKYIYCAFTTKLVKFDLDGNVIGSVGGLMGHLGCLDFCDSDGRVYGSLEYKNDCIGQGIIKNIVKTDEVLTDGFYIAIFDVDRITRPDMDAERDGIMTAVYLTDVLADYTGHGDGGNEHRYGCSGIDGLSFGPEFGKRDGKYFLNVAYGIYGDVTRCDNDYQVILHYDTSDWKQYERPLRQDSMHRMGPPAPDKKYFVFTGNTKFGVQNLEYDAYTGNWLMAVYRGEKVEYPNYYMYVIDGGVPPRKEMLQGMNEEGLVLTLAKDGLRDDRTGITGWNFLYGSTGIHSFGNGYFYVSHSGLDEDKMQYADIYLYRYTGKAPSPFEIA